LWVEQTEAPPTTSCATREWSELIDYIYP